MKNNKLLSTKEAAELLGVNRQRVQTLISQDRLPAQKIGNNYAIKESDLQIVKDRPTGRPPKPKNGSSGDSQNKQSLKTAFDIAPDLMRRLAGKHHSGLSDLSANKKHLEGLGKKSAEKEGL